MNGSACDGHSFQMNKDFRVALFFVISMLLLRDHYVWSSFRDDAPEYVAGLTGDSMSFR